MKKSYCKLLAVLLMFSLVAAGFCACTNQTGHSRGDEKYRKYAEMTAKGQLYFRIT